MRRNMKKFFQAEQRWASKPCFFPVLHLGLMAILTGFHNNHKREQESFLPLFRKKELINMMKHCLAFIFLVFFCGSFTSVWAEGSNATAQPGKPVADKPEKGSRLTTPIAITGEGTDSIGAKLVMRLKERFNQSNLFSLSAEAEKDSPMLMLMISTQSEFKDRPAIGSVYSICWVFKQGKGYLPFLLRHAGGIVSGEDLEALIDKLYERTDGVASRYAHLWK